MSGECVCVSGFRRNANGLCVHIICPVNQYYNENLKSCVDRCPQHQVWIRNTCVCINGYEKYGSNCLPKCNINEKRIGGFCQCISGYVKNNAGICVPKVITCPPGQKAN